MSGPGPAEVYAEALRGRPCTVHGLGAGRPAPLPVAAWSGEADAADRALLAHCSGPTLDVGCGPGRMARHLLLRGVPVLGVDVCAEAVRQARRRGVPALRADVFSRLPGEGGWATALLADGNIGIGGDPAGLLGRVRSLLARDGRAVVEVAPPGTGLRTASVRLECDGRRSAPFRWAVVGPEALLALATAGGWSPGQVGRAGRRWFVVLGAEG